MHDASDAIRSVGLSRSYLFRIMLAGCEAEIGETNLEFLHAISAQYFHGQNVYYEVNDRRNTRLTLVNKSEEVLTVGRYYSVSRALSYLKARRLRFHVGTFLWDSI